MNIRLEVFIPSAVFLLSDEEVPGHPCPDWVSSLLLLRWSGFFLSRNLSGILAVCFFLATWQQKLLISRTFCLHSCLLAFLCNTVRVLQDHLLQPDASRVRKCCATQNISVFHPLGKKFMKRNPPMKRKPMYAVEVEQWILSHKEKGLWWLRINQSSWCWRGRMLPWWRRKKLSADGFT